MPLPSLTWQMSAGGVSGLLTFIGDTGVISGTINTLSISGYFDETSQTLSFIISDPLVTQGGFSGVAPAPFTLYTAQLIQVGSGATVYYLLVGSFSTIANGGALSPATWYAQHPLPIPIPPPPVSPRPPRPPRVPPLPPGFHPP
jgi:hypothetical protein